MIQSKKWESLSFYIDNNVLFLIVSRSENVETFEIIMESVELHTSKSKKLFSKNIEMYVERMNYDYGIKRLKGISENDH